eukprot:m.166704 g.166704  ORF g.166704 m.166704 type:complete len:53 (+) comp16438_c6_seq3:227-385(+)
MGIIPAPNCPGQTVVSVQKHESDEKKPPHTQRTVSFKPKPTASLATLAPTVT